MRKCMIYLLATIMFVNITGLSAQEKPKSKKKINVEKSETKPPDKTLQVKPVQVKTDKNPVKGNLNINPTTTPVNANLTGGRGDLDQIVAQSQPIVENKPNGQINWTEQYIEAKGQSVIDNERFKIPAQAKAMATRGAVVVAQRNLLEIINGVNVTSETKVQDMITVSDFIYTRVDGIIKGAKQIGEPIEKDGMIEVTMQIPIYTKDGLASAVHGAIPQTSKYAAYQPDANSGRDATPAAGVEPEAIAFNLNGQKYDPSMFPVVVDDKGNLLLDYSKIYDVNKGNFPKILQTSKELLGSVGANKAVELIDVVSSEPGKIVIDSKNSKGFWSKFGNTAGKIAKFLMMLI